jgi:hypothetical protein
MKFGEWLQLNENRSVRIDTGTFIQKVKEECSDMISLLKEDYLLNKTKKGIEKFVTQIFPFYRGIPNTHELLYINPSQHQRTPTVKIMGTDFYTNLIDNDPMWEEYPRRTYSVIFSNSKRIAEKYINPYLVFPLNDAKLGICPKSDIFISWKFLNINQSIIIVFNKIINAMLSIKGLPEEFREELKNYIEMTTILDIESFTNIIKKIVNLGYGKNIKNLDIIKKIDFNKDIESQIKDLFSPETNGFEIMDIKTAVNEFKNKNISPNYANEIWTESPCYLVKIDSEVCNEVIKNLFL